MIDSLDKQFKEACEFGLKLNQKSEEAITAPLHKPFSDETGRVLEVKCPACDAVYAVEFSRIYRTPRSFEGLRDQLQLRLEEDHSRNRKHRLVIHPCAGTMRPAKAGE
jgi:hypothetical protein